MFKRSNHSQTYTLHTPGFSFCVPIVFIRKHKLVALCTYGLANSLTLKLVDVTSSQVISQATLNNSGSLWKTTLAVLNEDTLVGLFDWGTAIKIIDLNSMTITLSRPNPGNKSSNPLFCVFRNSGLILVSQSRVFSENMRLQFYNSSLETVYQLVCTKQMEAQGRTGLIRKADQTGKIIIKDKTIVDGSKQQQQSIQQTPVVLRSSRYIQQEPFYWQFGPGKLIYQNRKEYSCQYVLKIGGKLEPLPKELVIQNYGVKIGIGCFLVCSTQTNLDFGLQVLDLERREIVKIITRIKQGSNSQDIQYGAWLSQDRLMLVLREKYSNKCEVHVIGGTRMELFIFLLKNIGFNEQEQITKVLEAIDHDV